MKKINKLLIFVMVIALLMPSHNMEMVHAEEVTSFSSCQLLIATDDESIFTEDTTVLSCYNGVYLTEYPNAETAEKAFDYYSAKADFVEPNVIFKVSDKETDNSSAGDADEKDEAETGADLSDMNSGDDAISILNDIVDDGVKSAPKGTIALIDTGVNAQDKNMIDSVDLLNSDGNGYDDNGHGTRMYETIIGEDPDARILSIKALDRNGRGNVSDIYAALMYAIESKVSIINLSVSAYSTLENSVVRDAVIEAVNNGITVVGAAGNNGRDVRYYIPGNIDEAVICAAIDEEGNPLSDSNYGATVDYFVTGESSSYAAARYTGLLSKYGKDGLSTLINKEKIFTNEHHSFDTPEEAEEFFDEEYGEIRWIYPDEEDSDFHVAAPTGWPSRITLDFTINSSTGYQLFSWNGNYFTIPTNDGGQTGTYRTGTQFNWTIRNSSGYDKTKFSLKKGKAFCTTRGAVFPGGAYGNGYELYYTATGSTENKKRYIRAGIATSNRPTSAGYQTFAIEAFLVSSGSEYDFTLMKEDWMTELHPSFEDIVYKATVHNEETGADVCSVKITLGYNGFPKTIDILSCDPGNSSNPTVYVNQNVTCPDGATRDILFVQIKQTISQNLSVILEELSVPEQNAHKKNAGTSKVLLEPGNKEQIITSNDAENLYDYIKFDYRGTIELYKSYDRNVAAKCKASSDFSLSGAEYTVYTDQACTKPLKNGTKNVVIKTNANGFGYVTDIPIGTYYVKETKASKGCLLDTKVYTVKVNHKAIYCSAFDENIDISPVFDPEYYFTHSLGRIDKERLGIEDADPENLTAEQIEIMAKHYMIYGIKEGRTGSRNFYSVFYMYNYPDLAHWIISHTEYKNNPNGYTADINDFINIVAHYCRYGMMEGRYASITSFKDEYRQKGTYQPGKSVSKTLTLERSFDANGDGVKEFSYNKSFSVWQNVVWDGRNDVEGNGSLCPVIYSEEKAAREVRADIEFTKMNEETGEGLAGASFEIKNTSTGEAYTVFTDENGYYSTCSDYKSHKAADGIWFKLGKHGIAEETPDDSAGALTAGTYQLKELTSGEEDSLQKEEVITFTVTEEGSIKNVYDTKRKDGNTYISDMGMPEIKTTAYAEAGDDRLRILPADRNVRLVDVCSYKNLRADTEYTLYGRLMLITEEGEAESFTVDGSEVTAIAHFKTGDTYEASLYDSCGEAEVSFDDLDMTDYQGRSFVVFERLYLGELTEEDIEEGEFSKGYEGSNNGSVTFPIIHEDKDDEGQTLRVPDGHTNAVSDDSTKTVSSVGQVVIEDRVTYASLVPGREYSVSGRLYVRPEDVEEDKVYTPEELEELQLLDDEGNPVTSETSFIPTEADGEVTVTFTFDAKNLTREKRTIVAFEDCYDTESGMKVFTHADLYDEAQTVYQPYINTQAKGTEGRNELLYSQGVFTDTIFYENLEPETTYVVRGIAMDKSTGEALMLGGVTVEAEAEFVTGSDIKENGACDGVYELTFDVPEDMQEDLIDKDFVIFEAVSNQTGTLVATHNDINYKGQELYVPKIGTTLTNKASGDHTIVDPSGEIKLCDRVEYSNLTEGREYIMSGKLMNKDKNTELLGADGKPILASAKFTAAEGGKGTVDVIFTFDGSILKGHDIDIVAFEECIPADGTVPVGTHSDINDKGQTVTVRNTPKTGDDAPILLYMGLSVISLIAIVILMNRRRKKYS